MHINYYTPLTIFIVTVPFQWIINTEIVVQRFHNSQSRYTGRNTSVCLSYPGFGKYPLIRACYLTVKGLKCRTALKVTV